MRWMQRLKQGLHGLRRSRFCQMMVAPRVERAAPVLLLAPAGYGNQDDGAAPRRRPDLCGQLVSIEIREADIQEKRVRTEGRGEFERTSAGICCLDVVTR